MKIAVLGAGITGLASAHYLARHHQVTVFEARQRAGGNIWTETLAGCRVEWGTNGFLDSSPPTLELVAELGLDPRLLPADRAAANRFVWRDGRLRALPRKPQGFLISDCLPLGARLRALAEPFIRSRSADDESVFDFARRRLGRGAAEILVDGMVTGVFAGDPQRLSLASAFPKLQALEANYGSLVRGARGRGFGPSGHLTSFDDGLQVLIEALVQQLDVRLGTSVDKISDLTADGFDQVLCTVPAARAADLVPAPLAELLRRIPSAPVAVVALVFDSAAPIPKAFGFLAPHNQGLNILGALCDSFIFPGRAPADRHLVRVLIGGRRQPDLVNFDDNRLLEIALTNLERAWGPLPSLVAHGIVRHRLGIAQYERGHADLLRAISSQCPANLRLAGSSYRGVALNACIQDARSWSP